GQRRAAAIAHKEGAAQVLLEGVDACAHRRLGDVQPVRRADEAAGGDDGEEGPGQLSIQGHLARLYRNFRYQRTVLLVCQLLAPDLAWMRAGSGGNYGRFVLSKAVAAA